MSTVTVMKVKATREILKSMFGRTGSEIRSELKSFPDLNWGWVGTTCDKQGIRSNNVGKAPAGPDVRRAGSPFTVWLSKDECVALVAYCAGKAFNKATPKKAPAKRRPATSNRSKAPVTIIKEVEVIKEVPVQSNVTDTEAAMLGMFRSATESAFSAGREEGKEATMLALFTMAQKAIKNV